MSEASMNESPEIPTLEDLRQKVLAGQEVTAEEYNQIISALRQNRRSAAPEKATKGGTTRAKLSPEQGQALLDGFA